MIPKSVQGFSEKIMRKQLGAMTIRSNVIAL